MLTSPVTRAEISRSRLIANFKYLRSLLPASDAPERAPELAASIDLLAVVKANAYGHGLSPCAPWLVQAGANWLGITSIEEGVALRRLCPKARVLVMRGLMQGEADALIEAQLIPTVCEPQQLVWLADAAQKHNLALGSVPIHLEIDSGMSRQGVGLADLMNLLDTLQHLPALRLSGVYTHFASADMLDAEQNQMQRAAFRKAVDQVFAAGVHPQWIHAGNSSTLLAQQHDFDDVLPTTPVQNISSGPELRCTDTPLNFPGPIVPPLKKHARGCSRSSPGKPPSHQRDRCRPEPRSATTPPSSLQPPCGSRCCLLAMPTD